MVAGYRFNVWGKFDNFFSAVNFVYGPNWHQTGGVFVHWGPNGEPRSPFWFIPPPILTPEFRFPGPPEDQPQFANPQEHIAQIADEVDPAADEDGGVDGQVNAVHVDNGAIPTPAQILLQINRANNDDIEEEAPLVVPDGPVVEVGAVALDEVVHAVDGDDVPPVVEAGADGDDVEFVLLRM